MISLGVASLAVLFEFQVFIPIYLSETFDLIPAEAGMASAAFPLECLIAVFAGGFVFDKLSRKNLIIDAGMNDLLRPSMYDAFHAITPVNLNDNELRRYQIVGPICETGDTFARNRQLPRMQAGDLIAIRDVGAYGAVMASSYNTRPLVPEVLVERGTITVIRKRPGIDELISLDSL